MVLKPEPRSQSIALQSRGKDDAQSASSEVLPREVPRHYFPQKLNTSPAWYRKLLWALWPVALIDEVLKRV